MGVDGTENEAALTNNKGQARFDIRREVRLSYQVMVSNDLQCMLFLQVSNVFFFSHRFRLFSKFNSD